MDSDDEDNGKVRSSFNMRDKRQILDYKELINNLEDHLKYKRETGKSVQNKFRTKSEVYQDLKQTTVT